MFTITYRKFRMLYRRKINTILAGVENQCETACKRKKMKYCFKIDLTQIYAKNMRNTIFTRHRITTHENCY